MAVTVADGAPASVDEGGEPLKLVVAAGGDKGRTYSWRRDPALGELVAGPAGEARFTPPPVNSTPSDTVVMITAASDSGAQATLRVRVRTAPLVVTGAEPNANTIDVPVDVSPRLTFDRFVARGTTSAVTLSLRSPVQPVPGTTDAAGKVATLRPMQPLAWGTRYTLSAADAYRAALDGQGAPLALSFETPQPRWRSARAIVGPDLNAAPTAAVLGQQVLTVWLGETCVECGSLDLRFVTYSLRDDTVSVAQRVHNLPVSSSAPHVASDGVRTAFVVWQQTVSPGVRNVHASRFDPVTRSWSSPLNLMPDDHDASSSQVAADGMGNFVVVWRRTEGGKGRIYATRYVAQTDAWSAAQALQQDDADALTPQVAADAQGNVIAVWAQDDGQGPYRITAARFVAQLGTWRAAERIQQGSGDASSPGIAMNGADAIVVWSEIQPAAGARWITARRFQGATGLWDPAATLQSAGSAGSLPQVSVDAAGNGLVLWQQNTDTTSASIESARYEAATHTWKALPALQAFSPSDPTLGPAPALSQDSAGNVIASWSISPAHSLPRYVYAARFSSSSASWSAVSDTFSLSSRVGGPCVASDPYGNAALFWVQNVRPAMDSLFVARLGGP